MRVINLLYKSRRADRFHSKNYEFVKRFAHILHKPRFNIKDSRQTIKNLTYRKVNYWDGKGLVSSARKTRETGWRRFSVVDVIKLHILSDLKRIGLNTEKIKHVLDSISLGTIVGHKPEGTVTHKFLELEHCICTCMTGEKILLLVKDDAETMLLDEEDIVKSHFFLDDAKAPAIILPFFFYVKKILAIMGKEINIKRNSTIEELVTNVLTEQEEKILEVIRNKAFQKIEIVKSDNEQFIIYETSYKKGVFSNKDIIEAINKGLYQNITVFTKDGKKIGLRKEKKIRI